MSLVTDESELSTNCFFGGITPVNEYARRGKTDPIVFEARAVMLELVSRFPKFKG